MTDQANRLGEKARQVAERVSELSGWPAVITPGVACWRITNPDAAKDSPLSARECRVLHHGRIIGFDVHSDCGVLDFASADRAAVFLLACPSRQFVRRTNA